MSENRKSYKVRIIPVENPVDWKAEGIFYDEAAGEDFEEFALSEDEALSSALQGSLEYLDDGSLEFELTGTGTEAVVTKEKTSLEEFMRLAFALVSKKAGAR